MSNLTRWGQKLDGRYEEPYNHFRIPHIDSRLQENRLWEGENQSNFVGKIWDMNWQDHDFAELGASPNAHWRKRRSLENQIGTNEKHHLKMISFTKTPLKGFNMFPAVPRSQLQTKARVAGGRVPCGHLPFLMLVSTPPQDSACQASHK